MDRIVLDLLKFYQKEMRETKEAAVALKILGLDNGTVEAMQLAYSTGKAFEVAGKDQRKALRALDLAGNKGDKFKDSVIVPVYNENGALVDMYGLRPLKDQVKRIEWQNPPQGIIGIASITVYPEIILTDTVLYGLQIFNHGHHNVVSLRGIRELETLCPLLVKHDVRRVYILSRSNFNVIEKAVSKAGIEVVRLTSPKKAVEKRHLEIVGTLPLKSEEVGIKLLERSSDRMVFDAEGTIYRLDSMLMSGMGMKVQIRAESDNLSFRDKLDLASATQRRKFSRTCGMKFGISPNKIEDQISRIADMIDEIQNENADAKTKLPKKLKRSEKDAALSVLSTENVLEYLSASMEERFHFIGEEENRKLALLIAASRLLDKPLGGIIRGAAGCGKSELIRTVTKTLPFHEVLYFSRMTSQSLYFMPRDMLQNKLLVVDEYEGMQEAEYAVRTMMSSQTLSLAITLREGGRVPVTKTVEIPATVAILVSTTGVINSENLSRFIELRMDSSPEQNERVIKALAKQTATNNADAADIHNLAQLLRPCKVSIPYADKLIYKSGNVLARRQFSQVVGLISAHAALCQHQRENSNGCIVATKEDYKAVYPLLGHVIEHFEEGLSPSSMMLLEAISNRKASTLTRKDAMDWLGWPYSKAYNSLKELASVDLLIPDTMTNGTLRTYEAAPYFHTGGGISHIAPPQAI